MYNLLKRKFKEDKRKMAAFALASCSILIPTAIALAVLGISQHWPPAAIVISIIFAILGFVFWALGFKATLDEVNNSRDIQITSEQSADQRHREILQLLIAINDSIKNMQNAKNKPE
jgi:hypothetical protein